MVNDVNIFNKLLIYGFLPYGSEFQEYVDKFVGIDYTGEKKVYRRLVPQDGSICHIDDICGVDDIKIRRFPTGAIRSDNTGRERYDFISPLAMKALAEYLANTENKFAQINYFKGIPEDACVESMMRHLYDYRINGTKKEAVGILFNAVALVHTIMLRERGEYNEIYKQTELINKSDFKDE